MTHEETIWRSKRFVAVIAILVGLALVTGIALFLFIGSGGRPVPAPKTVSFSGKEAVGERTSSGESVVLTADQVRNAGILSEAVVEGTSNEAGVVTGTGIIQANSYKDVRVAALLSGILRKVGVEAGDRVAKGAVIGIAESPEFIRAQSVFLSTKSALANSRLANERAIRLLDLNPNGKAEAAAATKALNSANATLVESRSRYERAKKLVEIGSISREQFEAELAKLRTAEADVVEAEQRLGRANTLLDIRPEAKTEAEAAAVELAKAEGEHAAARQRLVLLGMTEEQISKLKTATDILQEWPLRAPIDGTVVARPVAPGETFTEGRELFRVADLTDLWFVAQMFERDRPQLKKGTVTEVFVGGSSESVTGKIEFIDPSLNEKTRTVQVRVVLPNKEGKLLIGSYATLKTTSGADSRKVALVKSSALVKTDIGDAVFVVHEDGLTFELRPVRVGTPGDALVPIIEGLNSGERVVVEGALLLRAELLKRNPS